VPARGTFDLMVLVESRNPVESRQMFEESWEVGPVCDVFVLLESHQMSTADIHFTRQGGSYFRMVNGHWPCRKRESILGMSHVPSSSPPTHDSSC
jgi:hypothetical protein